MIYILQMRSPCTRTKECIINEKSSVQNHPKRIFISFFAFLFAKLIIFFLFISIELQEHHSCIVK